MNVQLPEKNKIEKNQLMIYISIALICVISIVIAFYVQFFARIDIGGLIGFSQGNEFGNKTDEQIEIIKADFDNIFTNSITVQNENNNKKEDSTKEMVYTNIQRKESKLNSYDIEVNIPYINVDSDIAKQYNKEIQDIFVTKMDSILASQNENIIYTVEYVANVQDDILSVIIKSNLKEGASAQRVIIQTYNYDLRNNKEISLEEVLSIRKLNKDNVKDKIISEIEIQQKNVEELRKLGYNIYSRDISSQMYNLENSKEFYLTEKTLYIIYAYGNQTFTSEMDLVIF